MFTTLFRRCELSSKALFHIFYGETLKKYIFNWPIFTRHSREIFSWSPFLHFRSFTPFHPQIGTLLQIKLFSCAIMLSHDRIYILSNNYQVITSKWRQHITVSHQLPFSRWRKTFTRNVHMLSDWSQIRRCSLMVSLPSFFRVGFSPSWIFSTLFLF